MNILKNILHSIFTFACIDLSYYVTLGKFLRKREPLWSIFSYNYEKISEIHRSATMLIIALYYVLCQFFQKLVIEHVVKMKLLRGELMRFIIYVGNVQHYMRALQAHFVKLHTLYILKSILTRL